MSCGGVLGFFQIIKHQLDNGLAAKFQPKIFLHVGTSFLFIVTMWVILKQEKQSSRKLKI